MSSAEERQKFADHLKRLCATIEYSALENIIHGYHKAGEMERNRAPDTISFRYVLPSGREKDVLIRRGETYHMNMLRILTQECEVPASYAGDIDDFLRPALLAFKIKSYEEVLEDMASTKRTSILPYDHADTEIWPKRITISEKS
jgi:hypothetical protein